MEDLSHVCDDFLFTLFKLGQDITDAGITDNLRNVS